MCLSLLVRAVLPGNHSSISGRGVRTTVFLASNIEVAVIAHRFVRPKALCFENDTHGYVMLPRHVKSIVKPRENIVVRDMHL
jgi:hypothetical protein